MILVKISFLIPMLPGAKGQSLCNSHNSLGYSKSTSKTQTSELLMIYLLESDLMVYPFKSACWKKSRQHN